MDHTQADFVKSWLEKTDYLCYLGKECGFEPACFWSRGIVPANSIPDWLSRDKDEPQRFVIEHSGASFMQASLATDGRLQKTQAVWHSEAGRACAGAALLEWGDSSICDISAAALGGVAVIGRQTVPRAELLAGAMSPELFNLRPRQVQEWFVDASHIYKGCLNIKCAQPEDRERMREVSIG